MELLKAYWHFIAVAVITALFLLTLSRRRNKKRRQEEEITQKQRRDEALTEALRNPRVRERTPVRPGPVEITWEDKTIRSGKTKPELMVELLELSAFSRRKYIFHAGTPISMGSGADNQIALPREGVAKRHCEIFADGSRLGVRSVNGARTALKRGKNAIPVDEDGVYLKNGDRIQFGSAEVEFRLFRA